MRARLWSEHFTATAGEGGGIKVESKILCEIKTFTAGLVQSAPQHCYYQAYHVLKEDAGGALLSQQQTLEDALSLAASLIKISKGLSPSSDISGGQ